MRQVATLSALLAVSLIGSYLTWTDDDVSAEDNAVSVYQASPDDLQMLSLTSEETDVEIDRRSDDNGSYLWISVTERKTKRPVDPVHGDLLKDPAAADEASKATDADPEEGADSSAGEGTDEPAESNEPEVEVSHIEFAGNETADELWADFAPLLAIRELPETSEDLDLYGLAEPELTITATRRSGEVDIEIGGEAYGTRHRYANVDGNAYLLDHSTLRPLQYAKTRLVERRLYPYDESDIEQVRVQRDIESRAFVQVHRDDRAKAFWANADAPQEEDLEGGAWLGKMFRVKVHSYDVSDVDIENLEPVFSLEVTGDQSWSFSIHQERDVEKPDFYANSQFTRSWVKLTKGAAREAIANLDDLLDQVDAEQDTEDEAPSVDDEPGDDAAQPTP